MPGFQAGGPMMLPSTKRAPPRLTAAAMRSARWGEMALASTYRPVKPCASTLLGQLLGGGGRADADHDGAGGAQLGKRAGVAQAMLLGARAAAGAAPG